MDLDPQNHCQLVFSECGTCTQCCDGSLFTSGFVPLMDFDGTADCFPIVFHKIYGKYWPGMIYTLKLGIPCPYLDSKQKRCRIYQTYRPVACIHFPFRFKAKQRIDQPPFVGFPFNLEMDERCPALTYHLPGQPLLTTDGSLSPAFLKQMAVPKQTDFVEVTQAFCREIDQYGLFVKKKFKRNTASGKPIKAVFRVIDRPRLEADHPALLQRYEPYLMAHWRSLDKPRKLIEGKASC
ncbi:MAG: SapC family protein [Magnetococcales bacterium]|nr:SapC family protein [Magnetococcales bacterium]